MYEATKGKSSNITTFQFTITMTSYNEFRDVAMKEDDFWWDRMLIRRISTRLSWLLYTVFGPLNPNIVTVGGFVLGILGCLLIAIPRFAAPIIGIGLLFVWILTDRVDGELARYGGRTSTGGAFLDNVVDNTLLPLLLLATTVHVYWQLSEWYVFVIGTTATTFFILTRLVFGLRAENLQKSEKDAHPREEFEKIQQEPTLVERIGIYLVTVYDISKRSHNMVFLFSAALLLDFVVGSGTSVAVVLLVIYLGMVPLFFAITYGTFKTLNE